MGPIILHVKEDGSVDMETDLAPWAEGDASIQLQVAIALHLMANNNRSQLLKWLDRASEATKNHNRRLEPV